jgi:hypothetical protein
MKKSTKQQWGRRTLALIMSLSMVFGVLPTDSLGGGT